MGNWFKKIKIASYALMKLSIADSLNADDGTYSAKDLSQGIKDRVMEYVDMIGDPSREDQANEFFKEIEKEVQSLGGKAVGAFYNFVSDAMSSGLISENRDGSEVDAISNEIKSENSKTIEDIGRKLILLDNLIKTSLGVEIKEELIDRDNFGFIAGVFDPHKKRARAMDMASSLLDANYADTGSMIFTEPMTFKSTAGVSGGVKLDTIARFFKKNPQYFPLEEYRRDISNTKQKDIRHDHLRRHYNRHIRVGGISKRLLSHLVDILVALARGGNGDLIEFCADRISVMIRERARQQSFKIKNETKTQYPRSNSGDFSIDSIEGGKAVEINQERADRAKTIVNNLSNFYNGLSRVSNKIVGIKNFLVTNTNADKSMNSQTLVGMLDQYDKSVKDISNRIRFAIDEGKKPEEVELLVAHIRDNEVSFNFNGSEVVLDALGEFGSFDFSPKVDFLEIYESIAGGEGASTVDKRYAKLVSVMRDFVGRSGGDGADDFIRIASEDGSLANSFISGLNRSTGKMSKDQETLLFDLVEIKKSGTPKDRLAAFGRFMSSSPDGANSLRQMVRTSFKSLMSTKKGNLKKKRASDAIRLNISSIEDLHESKRGDKIVNSIISSMLVGLGVTDIMCKIIGMRADKKNKEDSTPLQLPVVKSYDEIVNVIDSARDGDTRIGGLSTDEAKRLLNLYVDVFNLSKDGDIDLKKLKIHCLREKNRTSRTSPEMRSAIVENAVQSDNLDRALWAPVSTGREIGYDLIPSERNKRSYNEIYLTKLGDVIKMLGFLKSS